MVPVGASRWTLELELVDNLLQHSLAGYKFVAQHSRTSFHISCKIPLGHLQVKLQNKCICLSGILESITTRPR
mgnify:CR=1 FL=1